jgi:hypothetical protein
VRVVVSRAAQRHCVDAQTIGAFFDLAAPASGCTRVSTGMPHATPKKRASLRRLNAARYARDAVDEDADTEQRDARAEKRRRTVRAEPRFLRSKTRFKNAVFRAKTACTTSDAPRRCCACARRRLRAEPPPVYHRSTRRTGQGASQVTRKTAMRAACALRCRARACAASP